MYKNDIICLGDVLYFQVKIWNGTFKFIYEMCDVLL